MATIRYEYQRPGKGTAVYQQELLLDLKDVSVLFMRNGGPDVIQNGENVLPRGGSAMWFVFPDRWYDVGRFYREDGTLTGWYTNLCTPVVKDGGTWSSTDLFLDLWQPFLGEGRWLDENELAAAVGSGTLDGATMAQILTEQLRITTLMSTHEWPPHICREYEARGFSIPSA